MTKATMDILLRKDYGIFETFQVKFELKKYIYILFTITA